MVVAAAVVGDGTETVERCVAAAGYETLTETSAWYISLDENWNHDAPGGWFV
jgi:hypothetical protein